MTNPDRTEFELFDTATGRSMGVPVKVDDRITKMVISHHNRLMAVVLEDGSVRLWNAMKRELHAPMTSFDTLPEMDFSPEDGTLIAGG